MYDVSYFYRMSTSRKKKSKIQLIHYVKFIFFWWKKIMILHSGLIMPRYRIIKSIN